MSELTYVPLAVEHAEALEELELAVFASISPDDLYNADELRVLAETFPEGNFVVLDDGRPVGMGLGILVEFDFAHTSHALVDITGENGVEHHSIDHPWYYGTDISVYPEYRGRGIGDAAHGRTVRGAPRDRQRTPHGETGRQRGHLAATCPKEWVRCPRNERCGLPVKTSACFAPTNGSFSLLRI